MGLLRARLWGHSRIFLYPSTVEDIQETISESWRFSVLACESDKGKSSEGYLIVECARRKLSLNVCWIVEPFKNTFTLTAWEWVFHFSLLYYAENIFILCRSLQSRRRETFLSHLSKSDLSLHWFIQHYVKAKWSFLDWATPINEAIRHVELTKQALALAWWHVCCIWAFPATFRVPLSKGWESCGKQRQTTCGERLSFPRRKALACQSDLW